MMNAMRPGMTRHAWAVALCASVLAGCAGANAPADVPFEAEADTALEAAILEASPSYTKSVVSADNRASWARYIYNRADLNGDGRAEVLVYMLGSSFCGTGGCTLLVFAPAEAGYTLVDAFPVSRTPVTVSPASTSGWSDLVRLESGGGAAPSYVRHTFDGTRYVERERMPAAQVPEGTRYLVGDLGSDIGALLEPADEAAPGSGPAAPAPSETGFATVCGVTAQGQEYRYRCTVEGAAPGVSGTTDLHFPDNAVTITWLADGKATATFLGMVPQPITVTTADGVTRFPFEDKVYFYASDPAVAAAQLKTLR